MVALGLMYVMLWEDVRPKAGAGVYVYACVCGCVVMEPCAVESRYSARFWYLFYDYGGAPAALFFELALKDSAKAASAQPLAQDDVILRKHGKE